MNTDWKALREMLEAKLDQGEVAEFHDPAILELLRDMRDCAPVEFARLYDEFKRRRVATVFDQEIKKHAYRAPPVAREDGDGEREWIELRYDRKRVIDEVLPHLTQRPDIYVQGDALVRVTSDPDDGHPAISQLSAAAIAEQLTSTVTLYKVEEGREGPYRKPVQPEPVFINMIRDRKSYPGARVLRGIAEAPLMREDGTLFAETGYDPRTKYLCAYAGPTPMAPEAPTRDDALRALESLDDIIADFPFAEPIHRSAWLSMLFTAILRPQIEGPVPVFIITANVAGAGKTKLVDVVSIVAQGRTAARQPYTDDDRELNASITATLAQGTALALFDNVDRPFGGSMIEMLSTGDTMSVRRYGHNDSAMRLRGHTMFMVTGNNVVPRTRDVVRRVIVAELASHDERPEERRGFRHLDLLSTVRARRAELLGAAFTIVRAYALAGRPRADVAALGSFEGWSTAVRDMLLWLGQPDPVETQGTMRDEQDAQLAGLHDAWDGMFGEGEARTVSDALHAIDEAHGAVERVCRGDRSFMGPDSHEERKEVEEKAAKARRLQDALQGLVSQPWKSINAVTLGRQLAKFKGRVCKGRAFEADRRANTAAWKVVRHGSASEGLR
jgi:hypothetical protein